MEDCAYHHDCETAHTVDLANDEYNRRHIESLKKQYKMKTFNEFMLEEYKQSQKNACECKKETYEEWKEGLDSWDMEAMRASYEIECYNEGYKEGMKVFEFGERTVKLYEPTDTFDLKSADQLSFILDKGKVVKIKVTSFKNSKK